MGLLDFLKRKRSPSPPDDEPVDELLDDSDDERPSVHYVLAHYALRQVALGDPLPYLGLLASPDAGKFIDEMIGSVVEQLGQPADFTAADVKVHPIRIGDFPCAVIEMPEPAKMTEAYFTALVAMIDPAAGLPPEDTTIPARYITLEKGFHMDGTPRTVLAEWSQTAHSNYGDGPEPTLEAFAQAIEGVLK